MQWQRIDAFLSLILLVACGTTVGCAQEKGGRQPIDAKTIAVYEKLGAEYGGWEKQGYPNFTPEKRFPDQKVTPEIAVWGFHFKEFPKARLPEVAVPFGLDFMCTPVTDADLKELAHLKNLTTLILIDAKISDDGLKELASLSNLSRLDLAGTKVTDAGLRDLAPLKNLVTLRLVGTNVTEVGVAELRKALPKCDITHRLPPPDKTAAGDKKN